jgi:RNA polymerase sigma-70 factor (ECF subfamily)
MVLSRDEFYRLLLAERSILLGFIHSLVLDVHLAEDIFQNVVVAAISKHHQINDPVHLQAWLRKASRLEAMNILRKRKGHPTMDLNDSVLDLLEEQWDERGRHSGSSRLDALDGCLRKLTDKAKQLVQLRYSEGLSGARLAAAIGSNTNNVNVSLTRIHRFLQNCINASLRREGVHG